MTRKRPWHLWIIALFMLFIYAMGIYDFFMMLSHNAGYYASHGYGAMVVNYFTDYPMGFLVFWIANLLCGFLAPLFLLFRNQYAKHLALASAAADFILLALTFLLRDRWNVLGPFVAAFDSFILLITLGFYVYCAYIQRKG